ncbi:hypothetical protein C8R44DRAFT_786249 [Mycena epipterygia]|nr:hypothetical protein C8R44DRAFT_786249 [Mycena epipterygia]
MFWYALLGIQLTPLYYSSSARPYMATRHVQPLDHQAKVSPHDPSTPRVQLRLNCNWNAELNTRPATGPKAKLLSVTHPASISVYHHGTSSCALVQVTSTCSMYNPPGVLTLFKP